MYGNWNFEEQKLVLFIICCFVDRQFVAWYHSICWNRWPSRKTHTQTQLWHFLLVETNNRPFCIGRLSIHALPKKDVIAVLMMDVEKKNEITAKNWKVEMEARVMDARHKFQQILDKGNGTYKDDIFNSKETLKDCIALCFLVAFVFSFTFVRVDPDPLWRVGSASDTSNGTYSAAFCHSWACLKMVQYHLQIGLHHLLPSFWIITIFIYLKCNGK